MRDTIVGNVGRRQGSDVQSQRSETARSIGRLLILVALGSCRSGGALPELPRPAIEQQQRDVEAVSLLGQPLLRPTLPEDTRRRYEEALAEARQRSYADP